MKKLFDSVNLGTLTLKNRLIRAAIWENMASLGGYPTDKTTSFYEELAKGGAGLIITGYILVNQEGRMDQGLPEFMMILLSRNIAGLWMLFMQKAGKLQRSLCTAVRREETQTVNYGECLLYLIKLRDLLRMK